MRNRFAKGSGVFECACCGGRTRQNNDPSATHAGLCDECYELAGYDNMHNDDGTKPTEKEMQQYEKLLARIGQRHGADIQHVKDSNAYIWGGE